MTHVQQGQLGITNLKFNECLMDLPRVLRYVLCPIWKYDFHKQISRQNAKSILESHLVAGRDNEITGPRDLTPESYKVSTHMRLQRLERGIDYLRHQ